MAGRIGSEVEAVCRRCGDVWHIVIALTENRIAQVQCGECGARHRYRPSGGVATGAGRQPRSTDRKSPSRSPEIAAKPVVAADSSRPRRTFRPMDTYQVGDLMVHPTFGEGVVQATRGPTKMEVRFEAGTKLLVQGHRKG